MRREEKAKIVKAVLDDLFPNPIPPLNYSDNYTLLVAVLLSAQCTDARVNQVTPHLFKKAKTPFEMVELPVEAIEEIIRTCGLSGRKAKAIHELSEQLIERHGGVVPNTLEELEALSGVGHKTASVIMIHGFDIPAFPVDTHIHRCAKRWRLSSGKNVKKTEEDLKKTFDKKDWHKLHLQIIYFAREHCKAVSHDPAKCPICSKVQ